MSWYEHLTLESKNNVVRIHLICLIIVPYILSEIMFCWYKITINYLLFPFFYPIISAYTNTQKSKYNVLKRLLSVEV